MFISLGEFADLAAAEHLRLGRGLKVALDDQSPIIHKPILMNNIKDLVVKVNKAEGNKHWVIKLNIIKEFFVTISCKS